MRCPWNDNVSDNDNYNDNDNDTDDEDVDCDDVKKEDYSIQIGRLRTMTGVEQGCARVKYCFNVY